MLSNRFPNNFFFYKRLGAIVILLAVSYRIMTQLCFTNMRVIAIINHHLTGTYSALAASIGPRYRLPAASDSRHDIPGTFPRPPPLV